MTEEEKLTPKTKAWIDLVAQRLGEGIADSLSYALNNMGKVYRIPFTSVSFAVSKSVIERGNVTDRIVNIRIMWTE